MSAGRTVRCRCSIGLPGKSRSFARSSGRGRTRVHRISVCTKDTCPRTMHRENRRAVARERGTHIRREDRSSSRRKEKPSS
jgi:hypothetical protein